MKISIVTTVRNSADTIETCLRSVAMQDDIQRKFEIEHIVADGASDDGTAERAMEFSEDVRVVSEPDRSLFDGMNKGIRRASGDVIGTLNADDFYFHKSALGEVARAMSDPTVEVCHGNVVYVDAVNPARIVRVWRGGAASIVRMRRGWMPPHPSFFVRKGCYERFGIFREDLGTAADYELMVRFLVKEKARSVYVPNLWVAMRTGGASNASLHGRVKANGMDLKAWTVNELRPAPLFRVLKPARKIPQYLRYGARNLSDDIRGFLGAGKATYES